MHWVGSCSIVSIRLDVPGASWSWGFVCKSCPPGVLLVAPWGWWCPGSGFTSWCINCGAVMLASSRLLPVSSVIVSVADVDG